MYKRIISLILTLIMLITIVPSTIVAASEVRTMEGVEASGKQSECNRPEVDKSEENIIYMVNPLYEDVISIDDLKKKLDSSNDVQLFAASTGQYFSDYDSAVSYLRKQMVSRETEITLNFPASWFDSHKDELYWDLLYDAMKALPDRMGMRLYMDLLAVVFHTVMQDIYNIPCHIILMQSRKQS